MEVEWVEVERVEAERVEVEWVEVEQAKVERVEVEWVEVLEGGSSSHADHRKNLPLL